MKKLNHLKRTLLIFALLTGSGAGYAADDPLFIDKQFRRTGPKTRAEQNYSLLLDLCFFAESISSKDILNILNVTEPDHTIDAQGKPLSAKILELPSKALYKGLGKIDDLNPDLMKKLLIEQILPNFPKKNIKIVSVVRDSDRRNSVGSSRFAPFISSFPPHLESLALVNIHLGSDMLLLLAPKLKESNLKELELPNTGITPKTAQKIIENTPQTLEFLVLDGAALKNILGTLGLETKPNLNYLSLGNCKLTDTDIQNFTTQFTGKNLKALVLSDNDAISDKSAEAIKNFIERSSPEALKLNNTSLTGSGLKTLSPTIQKSDLKHLDLRNLKQMGKGDVETLVNIIKKSRLESLLVNIKNITKKEFRSITEAIKESSLTSFSLHKTFENDFFRDTKNKNGKPVRFLISQ
ncbi:MAG: hypothetical protein ACRCYZ_06275 [Alphaproteobacteria bacterium]